MTYIFYGLILILLDFSFNLGNFTIGLIPDFIGYILMIKGLDEIINESEKFTKIRPYVQGMAIYTGITYVVDLFGISRSLGIVAIILSIVSVVMSLYITYHIIVGLKDIEGKRGIDLNSDKLYSLWIAMVVLWGLYYIVLIIPIIALIAILAVLGVSIIFLVEYNKSKKVYEDNLLQ